MAEGEPKKPDLKSLIDQLIGGLANTPASQNTSSESNSEKESEIRISLNNLIQNLLQEKYDFKPDSPISLITKKPVYYPSFLKDEKEEVTCVLHTNPHGLIAVVLAEDGNYKAYKVKEDENGVLQHLDGQNILSNYASLKGFNQSLREQGVSENPDFGSQNIIKQEDLSLLEAGLQAGFSEEITKIENDLLQELEPKIQEARALGYVEAVRASHEEHLTKGLQIDVLRSSVRKLEESIKKDTQELAATNLYLQEGAQNLYISAYMQSGLKGKVEKLTEEKRKKAEVERKYLMKDLHAKSIIEATDLVTKENIKTLEGSDKSDKYRPDQIKAYLFLWCTAPWDSINVHADLVNILGNIDEFMNNLLSERVSSQIGWGGKPTHRDIPENLKFNTDKLKLSDLAAFLQKNKPEIENYIKSELLKTKQKAEEITEKKLQSQGDSLELIDSTALETLAKQQLEQEAKEKYQALNLQKSKLEKNIQYSEGQLEYYSKELETNEQKLLQVPDQALEYAQKNLEKSLENMQRKHLEKGVNPSFLEYKEILEAVYKGGKDRLSVWRRVPYLWFEPKQIRIPNQTPDSYDLLRHKGSFGGESQVVKETGDLVLQLPANNIQVFEKVSIVEQNVDYVKLAVTEVHADGEKETWHLEYGKNIKNTTPTGEEKLCVNLICSSGEKTPLTFGKNPMSFANAVKKPVISFRFGGKKIKVKVTVNFKSSAKSNNGKGEYKVIYPFSSITENNDLIWSGEVLENDLIQIANKKYPYLFWDGESDLTREFGFADGFCVKSEETISFLEEKCQLFGFDEVLTTDFVTFWAPYLLQTEYNLIRFLTEQECANLATLDIDCEEKLQIIRFYMLYQPVSDLVEVPEQKLEKVELTSLPKVFDWGGFQV